MVKSCDLTLKKKKCVEEAIERGGFDSAVQKRCDVIREERFARARANR